MAEMAGFRHEAPPTADLIHTCVVIDFFLQRQLLASHTASTFRDVQTF